MSDFLANRMGNCIRKRVECSFEHCGVPYRLRRQDGDSWVLVDVTPIMMRRASAPRIVGKWDDHESPLRSPETVESVLDLLAAEAVLDV